MRQNLLSTFYSFSPSFSSLPWSEQRWAWLLAPTDRPTDRRTVGRKAPGRLLAMIGGREEGVSERASERVASFCLLHG